LRVHTERHSPHSEQTARAEPGTRRPPRPGEPLWRGLPRAVAFLTIAPMPATTRDGLVGAAGWFPLAGAAIGALAGSVRVGAEHLLGRTPATVLTMIALVILTGALHQDGLADTADGLGARGERARRLQVMRDPATGAFGALALIGWALLMLATLASLDATHALIALTVACALARWAALLHAAAAPPARSDGLGAALHVSRPALAAATILSVVLSLALCGTVPGAAAIGTALLLALLSALLAHRTFGGRTGDTLGATIAVAEVVACVALLAAWH
jgi:adenosylcobinamide-GDP ribazoletransferase